MKKIFVPLCLSLSMALLFVACGRRMNPNANNAGTPNATASHAQQQEEVVIPNEQPQQQNENDFISKEQALNIVLERAGVSEKDITDLEIELDYDDDRRIWEYDISFDVGFTEYESEVNAVDGTIMEFHKDI